METWKEENILLYKSWGRHNRADGIYIFMRKLHGKEVLQCSEKSSILQILNSEFCFHLFLFLGQTYIVYVKK